MRKEIRLCPPRRIHAIKCYRTVLNKNETLMQLPRLYRCRDMRDNEYIVSSFRSLIRRGWRWYLDRPYYCYNGDAPHQYRAVPWVLNLKLHSIKLCGDIKETRYRLAHKLRRSWCDLYDHLNLVAAVRRLRERSKSDRFWRELGVK